jgi:PIN domain nuclease of toxin-antitoxin system
VPYSCEELNGFPKLHPLSQEVCSDNLNLHRQTQAGGGTTEYFARTLVTDHGFRQLPLELHEISRSEQLPMHHRDPFDRLLIAQAMEIGAVAVTNDAHWQYYPLKV